MSKRPSRRQILAGSALLGTATLAGRFTGSASADAPPWTDTTGRTPDAKRSHSDRTTRSPTLETDVDLEGVEPFVDDAMSDALDEHDIVGASVAVVHDDELVLTKGYGDTDTDSEAPVDADETRFRVGSVSKPIVWTAVMQLIEDDRIDPHEDVTTYLESVSIPETFDEPITMAHLATHTAGFEERFRGTWVTDPDDLRDLPTVLAEAQPERVRPPGRVASYSNYGTALAAQVVAAVAETPFEQYARSQVFEPLEMDQTTFEQPLPDDQTTDAATGYSSLTGTPQEAPGLLLEVAPAGSMTTTATDMAQFLRAHLGDGAVDGDRLLETETVAELHDQWFTHHDELDGIAFGFLEGTRRGVRVLEHNGHIPGSFYSDLCLVPDADLGLFVTYNTDSGATANGEFREAFFAEFLPAESEGESTPSGPDEPPTRTAELEGTYRGVQVAESSMARLPTVAQAGSADVHVDDDGFLVTDFGGGPSRWVEQEPLVFTEHDGDSTLAFGETDGEITHLFLGFQGFERASWHESLSVHAGVAGVTTLGMLSGAIGWPLARGWRRFRGARSDDDTATGSDSPQIDSPRTTADSGSEAVNSSSGEPAASTPESDAGLDGPAGLESQSLFHSPTRARWVAGGSIACLLGFLVGTLVVFLFNPYTLFSDPPASFRVVSLLPILGAIGAAVAAGYAVQSWRMEWWGLGSRVHYTLVVLATVGFCWVLYYWNFLGVPL